MSPRAVSRSRGRRSTVGRAQRQGHPMRDGHTAELRRARRRARRVRSDRRSGVPRRHPGSIRRLAVALSNFRNICLFFEVSTGTVDGMSTSPAAIERVAAPWDGAPLAGFAPARAQLARLEATALAATRAAAMACQRWIGHGSGQAADSAATDAMRSALVTAPGTGTVVIGEGVKDRAPMLYDGEMVGTRRGPSFDIAVDPLECMAEDLVSGDAFFAATGVTGGELLRRPRGGRGGARSRTPSSSPGAR
jgi:hypothetical protein